jgi:DUF4097 and DUF4098 domain-containing protein YvlB|tara:strand:+ start:17581 stop:17889 length:309 start_codon:yes stop_codon:yes gene_type:complete
MAANEIHVNDIGTNFIITVKEGGTIVNLAPTTSVNLLLMGPNDTTVTKTASFLTDGTDGKIKYQTVAGDLAVAGTWKLQAKVNYATTVYHSDIHNFTVFKNL